MIRIKKNRVYFIGEIGINHNGSVNKAKKYIDLAKKHKIDAIKLQIGSADKFTTIENLKRFNKRSKVNFSEKEIDNLINYSKKRGVKLFATPISHDYVTFVAKKFGLIKIASGDINFLPTLKLAAKSKKQTIISTGASSLKEIKNIFKIFKDKKKLIIMHCVSSYPTDIKNANLVNIKFLRDKFNIHVGYSNHVLGTNACEVAIALGARIIEFHFTDNKKRAFIDHKISLEPKDFDLLRKKANEIISSIGKKRLHQFKCEKNYKELRKGLVYKSNFPANHKIRSCDINFARPYRDFSSNDINKIIGLRLKKKVKKFYLIKKNDF